MSLLNKALGSRDNDQLYTTPGWPDTYTTPGTPDNTTVTTTPTTSDTSSTGLLNTSISASKIFGSKLKPSSNLANPDDMQAQILREQWNDYLTRLEPFRAKLAQMTSYMNPSLVGTSVEEAKGQAERTHAASQNAYSANLKGYGVIPSGDVATSNALQSELAKTSSLADAANRIRDKISERNRNIATGFVTDRPVSAAV